MGPCEDPPEGVLPANSLCRWIVQPEECCPRDFGPNGFVCEERKSCPFTSTKIVGILKLRRDSGIVSEQIPLTNKCLN